MLHDGRREIWKVKNMDDFDRQLTQNAPCYMVFKNDGETIVTYEDIENETEQHFGESNDTIKYILKSWLTDITAHYV